MVLRPPASRQLALCILSTPTPAHSITLCYKCRFTTRTIYLTSRVSSPARLAENSGRNHNKDGLFPWSTPYSGNTHGFEPPISVYPLTDTHVAKKRFAPRLSARTLFNQSAIAYLLPGNRAARVSTITAGVRYAKASWRCESKVSA